MQSEYEQLLKQIKQVKANKHISDSKAWSDFFYVCSDNIVNACELEERMKIDCISGLPFDLLKIYNRSLTRNMDFKFTTFSFSNITYSVECFGKDIGTLNTLLSSYLSPLIKLASEHAKNRMVVLMRLFLDYYTIFHDFGSDYSRLFELLKKHELEQMESNLDYSYFKRFSTDFDLYTNWIKNADLSNYRYLYYYGNFVSLDDIKTAEFINSLPQEKIDKVMHQTAKSYILGFEESHKDYRKKKTVFLMFRQGMERLARSLMLELENKYGLKVCVNDVLSGNYSQQYLYDNRFSNALFLDEAYVEHYIKQIGTAIEKNKLAISECSGGIYFDDFGQLPFFPENKQFIKKYSEKQMKLSQDLKSKQQMLFSKYYKRSENSFCIIGFPTPEIGKDFEEIFDKTLEINMLDHKHWLDLQQILIDTLDQADSVYIEGCGDNRTKLTVKLPKLKNPEKESNFANCGATVNIPVGEVFNTPQLEGTNGLLHVVKTYLNDLTYKNLELEFVDGRISSYNCSNYCSDEASKKFIEENLLFPHSSLPLGEFAIGTNTLAYAVAKKYNIMHLLPILIIEKMGPHFAIGDTCYSREEDTPVFNPDGKEIISRDNEQSIIRKEDPLKAYLNVHVDITLPYDEIGLIQAIKPDGERIDIIKDGIFMLEGLENLNEHLSTIDV